MTSRTSRPAHAAAATTLAVLLPLALAACGRGVGGASAQGEPTPSPSAVSPSVDARGRVLVSGAAMLLGKPDKGWTLCVGGVLESLPPAGCGGAPLDLGAVSPATLPGYQRFPDGTEQTDPVGVIGWWDGTRLDVVRVVDAATVSVPERPEKEWATACDDPGEGTGGSKDAAVSYANAQPDYAVVWVSEEERVLNVAFTGRLAEHERELRRLWKGPLCVVGSRYSERELQAVQERADRLTGADGKPLTMLSSGGGLDSVEVEVIWASAADVAAARKQLIPEAEVVSALTPVVGPPPPSLS